MWHRAIVLSVALVLVVMSFGVRALATLLRHRRHAFSLSAVAHGGPFVRPSTWGSPGTTTMTTTQRSKTKKARLLQMKDSSCSYWFQVGDIVQVSTTVHKAGIDLKGRRGMVTETWEKCSVDPTCCCAEFVDDNYAVTVTFQGPLLMLDTGMDDPRPTESSTPFIVGIHEHCYFTHHFNEDELVMVEKSSAQHEVLPPL